MTKSIETLVEDMENVILGNNGWDYLLGQNMASTVATLAKSRFQTTGTSRLPIYVRARYAM